MEVASLRLVEIDPPQVYLKLSTFNRYKTGERNC